MKITSIDAQVVVIRGNPVEGFRFFGPIPFTKIVTTLQKLKFEDTEWWLTDIEAPGHGVADPDGDHVLVYGNPTDGFTLIGPFATAEEAVNQGEVIGDDYDSEWWTVELEEVGSS